MWIHISTGEVTQTKLVKFSVLDYSADTLSCMLTPVCIITIIIALSHLLPLLEEPSPFSTHHRGKRRWMDGWMDEHREAAVA